jgi:hypothetical protein
MDVAFFGLIDLMVALALLGCFVAAIVLILLPGLTSARRAARVWFLVTALAGIGLFVAFNVAYFNPGDQPVTPTRAQLTGTWIAASGRGSCYGLTALSPPALCPLMWVTQAQGRPLLLAMARG